MVVTLNIVLTSIEVLDGGGGGPHVMCQNRNDAYITHVSVTNV